MHQIRRSGRIAKEIPIVLLGTSATGKVFSEQTKTVVLSRHGAGIVSRHVFAPDEILTLRMPGSATEAEIRLVGQIGGESGRYVYGVAFVDQNLQFWPVEFPPPEPYDPATHTRTLECSLCHFRQNVQQGDIEEDVYSVSGNVLRFCEQCGTSTPWKKAEGEVLPRAPIPPSDGSSGVSRPAVFAKPSTASLASFESSVSSSVPEMPPPNADAFHRSSESPLHSNATPPVPTSDPPAPSAYSGESSLPDFYAAGGPNLSGSPAPPANSGHSSFEARTPALAIAPTAAESRKNSARALDSTGRPVNRRRHVRIRVNFSACVRHPVYPDEIVECENVSKGGLCFRSRSHFSVDTKIEIAAPYSPGEAALFVPAQIKRVEHIPGSDEFRYGVAYLKPNTPER